MSEDYILFLLWLGCYRCRESQGPTLEGLPIYMREANMFCP